VIVEWVALLLFVSVILVLLAGFPVAFTLGGTALIFAGVGVLTGDFNAALLSGLPNRVFGIMNNGTLVAVPLFVFMGVTLERARIAEDLLETLSGLFGSLRGGLGISVTLVGMLLAASTGIVGATVVTMGLLSLPTMLRRGYSPEVSAGIICASGTLGQIIPPSIILVMLGDVMTSAYQQAQLEMGIFSPKTVSVGDLFAGALIPGLLLVLLYVLYIVAVADAHRGGRRRRNGRIAACHWPQAAESRAPSRGHAKHVANQQHGVPDSDRRIDILARLPWFRR